MSTFILGIGHSIRDSAFRTTDELYEMVGHNTGNLAFHYAISELLGGGLRSTSWFATPERIDATGSLGVMPCANQLGPHADFGFLAEAFSSLKCKLVAMGLGAQGPSRYGSLPDVPAGTVRWLEEIVRRAPTAQPNITLRGDFSHKVLERLGFANNAIVLGCPTLFLNPDPNLGKKIERAASAGAVNHVAVAAGHQEWPHLGAIEASLTRIMAATGGVYVAQSPMEMVRLGRGEVGALSEDSRASLRDFAAPELTLEQFTDWSVRYGRVFFDIATWIEYLRRFDFVVGLRIHGVMLGLQAGIPSLCIAHDSRTRELCETMKVPFVMASEVVTNGLSRKQLCSLFEFDGAAFDKNREALGSKMREFFDWNGLTVSRVFSQIVQKESDRAKAAA